MGCGGQCPLRHTSGVARGAQKLGATMQASVDLGNGKMMLSLDLGGVTMLISKTADEKQYGLAHFGIKTPHLQQAVDELKANGVKFTLEVTKISPTLKISFVQAPDNLRMELSEGR